jgi:hypothetical protein
MLDTGEAGDPESLSNRMAPVEETEPYDRDAYRDNRAVNSTTRRSSGASTAN